MITSFSLKKKDKRLGKKRDKKEPPQKQTKDDLTKFNEWVNKKETSINLEIFQKHFTFQKPSDMLKVSYTTNDKKKNADLVNVIKSGLSDLKKEIKDISKEKK